MRSSSKRRGLRAVLTGSLVAIAAACLPASAAANPAPTLLGTSVDSGWGRSATLLMATYDAPLQRADEDDVVVTKASLKNAAGKTLTGASSIEGKDKKTLKFVADNEMIPGDGPFTVTFRAHAVGQDDGVTDTVTPLTFHLDAGVPKAPLLETYPASIVAPGDPVVFEGKASDIKDGSGIARVELHFFNPVVTFPRTDEARQLRLTQDSTCSGGLCPQNTTFSFTAELPAGYWNVKVAAVDLAGNVSPESAPIGFLVLAAPEA
ncbi:MAG: hypothetical protein WDA27_10130 [Actinomycetota bacterium]